MKERSIYGPDRIRNIMVKCTACNADLNMDLINTPDLIPCVQCGSLIRAVVFAALFRERPAPALGETIILDDEASCFYHEDKKAVIPCTSCGRFLCALCDIDIDHQHLCPVCLQRVTQDKESECFENESIQYDNIALAVAVLPLLMLFLTIITAPLTIYLVIRHWKTPTGPLPRTKIRFVLAFLIALTEIIAWGMVLI